MMLMLFRLSGLKEAKGCALNLEMGGVRQYRAISETCRPLRGQITCSDMRVQAQPTWNTF